MPALLATLISGFTALLSFFTKIFPWINGLTSFLGGFLAYKTFKVGLLSVIAISVVSGMMAFLYLVFNLIFQLFTSIKSVLSYFSAGSGSGDTSSNVVSCFYWIMDLFGISTVFNIEITTFSTLFLAIATVWICKASFIASYNLYKILAAAL